MEHLWKTLHKCFLLIYTVVASVILGGLAGFLVLYPLLQILFDKLGSNYRYDQMIHYFVYAFVMCAIGYCFHYNWKRYISHTQKELVKPKNAVI
jgi:hypothetical protein